MRRRNNDPASKSGEKPPRPYQAYIIAAIILIAILFYVVVYW